MHDPFPSAKVSALVRDGETVSLGNKSLLAIATPGHSPGALSWQWQECEGEQCKMLVYADSLSPVSSEEYRFSDHPDYLAKYREGLVKLGSVDCDILLTPHPSASQMVKRLQESDGLVDSSACTRYAATISERLDKRLEKEHSLQQNNREDLE